jgi:hypothetical protein
MILQYLTEIAQASTLRYGFFLSALRSLYSGSLTSANFGTPKLRADVDASAADYAFNFIEGETGRIEASLREIAEIARTVTLKEIASIDTQTLTDEALEHISVSADYLRSQLYAQVKRDVATLRQALQRVTLEVSLSARARGKSKRSTLMEFLMGNKSSLDFTFHDRASRKWDSATFVRQTWRQTLLSIYNETVLFTLAEHGLSHAMIEHDSPGAEHHGQIISLSSGSEYPTYSEIRDKIFHPNANAYLRMEYDDVSA